MICYPKINSSFALLTKRALKPRVHMEDFPEKGPMEKFRMKRHKKREYRSGRQTSQHFPTEKCCSCRAIFCEFFTPGIAEKGPGSRLQHSSARNRALRRWENSGVQGYNSAMKNKITPITSSISLRGCPIFRSGGVNYLERCPMTLRTPGPSRASLSR
jgi:hypothetical protein